MKSRRRGGLARFALPGALLLAACSSDDPYSAADYAPSQNMRQPVVAPAGPLSPWWWPFGDLLWHFLYERRRW